ncbi:hypothetical protein FA13DRAFT_1507043 [Coprinellus micaceus]|uniref:Nephrocystin 3-like N-terminal domain-containing protein n=1 Tax=Coprinellus micaceus TaxID=71717 RepID=A0A4Y7SKY7_COPMI|nr:hypothetical protein FA13DRAFT_1507043 [Coprinellus micaceus]
MWLTGPAGPGETAIMGSVADTCEAERFLAGSFFFSSFAGSEKRRSKRYLVPTLVYYLVTQLPPEHPLRLSILTAVQQDPSVFRRRLDYQFTRLLLTPFNDTKHQFDSSILPKVFFIDGLDEVEAVNSRQRDLDPHEVRLANEEDQEEILSALLNATSDPTFPFRIVVASRLERVIQTFFSSDAAHVTREIFLDDKYDPDADIALYLRANFAKIRRRYRLPPSWPSAEDIRKLVYNASGQFIYAATVVRFLQSGKHPNSQAVLTAILDRRSQGSEIGALEPLDALYARILQSSPDPALAVQWISVIHSESLSESAHFMNLLLQDYDGQANYLLENLTSLIWVPPVEDLKSSYRFHHKSLIDFLGNKGRCGEDFGNSYEAGYSLYLERCADICLNKSPATRPPEPQHIPFLLLFTQRVPRLCAHGPAEKLCRCDVVWWAHFRLRLGQHEREEAIMDWFCEIHARCPIESPGNCLPHCKHWRSNTLRTCKGLGRPMILSPGGFVSKYHRPNTQREWLESSDARTPSTFTRYTADEDYQAILEQVADMFTRLPVRLGAQIQTGGRFGCQCAVEWIYRCHREDKARAGHRCTGCTSAVVTTKGMLDLAHIASWLDFNAVEKRYFILVRKKANGVVEPLATSFEATSPIFPR